MYNSFCKFILISKYPLNNLTTLSMFYLLFSLFCIIKICSLKYMSLRKIN